MDIPSARRCPRRLLVVTLACGLAAAAPVRATLVASLSFEDAAGAFTTVPGTLAAGVASLAFGDRAGTLSAVTGHPGRAASARRWRSGNAFELTVTLAPGIALRPTTLGFDERASASGPQRFTVLLNGRPVAAADTAQSFRSHTLALPTDALRGVMRIALEASGAGSDRGTWRLDNLALAGTVLRSAAASTATVSQPPTVPLLAAALLAAAVCRHRARVRARSSHCLASA